MAERLKCQLSLSLFGDKEREREKIELDNKLLLTELDMSRAPNGQSSGFILKFEGAPSAYTGDFSVV